MTDDAKKILIEYADGSAFGAMGVRSLLGGSGARAARAIDSLLASGFARPGSDDGRLYKLTAKGRDLAGAALQQPSLRGSIRTAAPRPGPPESD
ncbi:MAG: hypothetical protein F4164_06355 [Gemmatimonadales bacterium]|nr:hypothetical protein [Gemmatimonadales bacterium]MYG48982.1 hypothetical protein [Gemmatimonadales bacterium]MYK01858.1 hypothetical protein [Candidatus Palauibacter ramosifaciens]